MYFGRLSNMPTPSITRDFREFYLTTDGEMIDEPRRSSIWKRTIPLVGLASACALMLVGVAYSKQAPAAGKVSNVRGAVGLDEECEAVCKKDIGDRKERPLCKDERRLEEDPKAVAKLEAFFDQGSDDEEKKVALPLAFKSSMKTLETFNRQPLANADKSATNSKMAAFISDGEACISVRPVLTVTTPFTLTDMATEMPTEFFLPMFLRAYKESMLETMELNEKAVNVRLVDASRRLSTTEDNIPEKIGSKFMIIGEVTDPMPFVIEEIEGKSFVNEFSDSVGDKMNLIGSTQGLGNFLDFASHGDVQVVESTTNTLEGDYQSFGYNTVCRKDKQDFTETGEGHVEVRDTNSLRHCSQICNTRGKGCHGFEYNHHAGRCEIWKVPICYSEDVRDEGSSFECFRRCN